MYLQVLVASLVLVLVDGGNFKFRDYEIGQCMESIACTLGKPEVFRDSAYLFGPKTKEFLKDMFFNITGFDREEATFDNWNITAAKTCALSEHKKMEFYEMFAEGINKFYQVDCLENFENTECGKIEEAMVVGATYLFQYTLTGVCRYDAQKVADARARERSLDNAD